MGEIADMMLDGTLDAYSGEYIGRGKGIPRTLDKSLPWEKRDHSAPGFTKSINPAMPKNRFDQHNKLAGVMRWLDNFGMASAEECHKVLRLYCAEKKVHLPKVRPMLKAGSYASDNFTDFITWVNAQQFEEE